LTSLVVKPATAAKAAVAQSNANRVAAEPAIAGPNQNSARTLRGFFTEEQQRNGENHL
jgi:hypothetical protein